MEGPQVHALADVLAEHITGQPVERIDVPPGRWQANVLLHNCVAQVIQRTRAHGKWLFLDFSHGVTWATEMVGRASWQTNGRGEKHTDGLLTIQLRTGQRATLTGRPAFLILPTENLYQHAELRSLGPDPITSPDYTVEFPQRLRQAAGRTLASALLDQEIVAGLGNPLKCEALFAIGAAPGMKVGTLLSSHVEHLCRRLSALLKDAYRAARQGESYDYAVYDRAGEPCPRCGSDIAVERSGADGHETWFCPVCQKPQETTGLF